MERLALAYVGRYATTRAKLGSYLERKLRERGWAERERPPVETLVERLASLGYIDDAAYASARAASLMRRGYGGRRVDQALRAAGIAPADAARARETTREGAWAAAISFAERKRIGPYAAQPADRETRGKAIAAMLRAGHAFTLVRKLIDAPLGEFPELDAD